MPLFRKSPPTTRERTAQDRERERVERERRRAERDGRAYDPSLLEQHAPAAPSADGLPATPASEAPAEAAGQGAHTPRDPAPPPPFSPGARTDRSGPTRAHPAVDITPAGLGEQVPTAPQPPAQPARSPWGAAPEQAHSPPAGQAPVEHGGPVEALEAGGYGNEGPVEALEAGGHGRAPVEHGGPEELGEAQYGHAPAPEGSAEAPEEGTYGHAPVGHAPAAPEGSVEAPEEGTYGHAPVAPDGVVEAPTAQPHEHVPGGFVGPVEALEEDPAEHVAVEPAPGPAPTGPVEELAEDPEEHAPVEHAASVPDGPVEPGEQEWHDSEPAESRRVPIPGLPRARGSDAPGSPNDAPGRRLPPPPSRREALMARRARRVRQRRVSTRASDGLVTRGRIGALLVVAAVAFVIWFAVSLFQPFTGSGQGQVLVAIPKGASASKIGSILSRDGVVSSGFFFNLRSAVSGKRGDLHSGRFELRRGMSYASAIAALSKPPPPVITVKVLIPEGETRHQIASLATADGLAGSYLAASTRSPAINLAHYGAPRGTPSLEGFLFPATYQLRAGATARQLVADQLIAFRQDFSSAVIRSARRHHVTPYQLLIVASMVEREAAVARDRPLVAAVIYNRLRLHMPLGIDATIRYAINDYTRPLTAFELRINSPFNTRTRIGLPPTPISNPGLASIDAAARPAHAPYLYYVAAPDGCGEHRFSSNFAQFQQDAAAYQAALTKNGGRVPTCHTKG